MVLDSCPLLYYLFVKVTDSLRQYNHDHYTQHMAFHRKIMKMKFAFNDRSIYFKIFLMKQVLRAIRSQINVGLPFLYSDMGHNLPTSGMALCCRADKGTLYNDYWVV